MIPLYRPEQVQAMDQRAFARGVDPAALMDLAAARVTQGVLSLVDERGWSRRGLPVVAVCGKGNNGGDGIAVVRHLRARGVAARAVLLAPEEDLSADAARELSRLRQSVGGVRAVVPVGGCGCTSPPPGASSAPAECEHDPLAGLLDDTAVVVDCILGTGATGEPRGISGQAVSAINAAREAGAAVVACDLPTGVDATTGRIPGEAVHADLTVTLGAHKLGLWLHPAAEQAGQLHLGEIGVDDGADPAAATVLEAADLPVLLPPAGPRAHKRTRGVVVIYAGSEDMAGAAVLAARGALSAGAGLITLATPRSVAQALTGRVPEVMLHGLPDDAEGIVRAVTGVSQKAHVLAIGPGLGLGEETQKAVRRLVVGAGTHVVLDADGINAFRDHPDLLAKRPQGEHMLVMTPHAQEHGRLIGSSGHGVHARRTEAAAETAERFSATVVAKGPRSVVAAPDGRVWVTPTGGPELATGGTGDVLTGITAAFVAQRAQPTSVAVATWVHGRAGELSAGIHGTRGTTAGTVADQIGAAAADAGL